MDATETAFWQHVNKHGPRAGRLGRCYDWTGGTNDGGYGQFWDGARTVGAHRYAYGPVPEGLTVDHLCKRPICVRRSHLEAVTQRVNILRGNGMAARNARKTHCPAGHRYAGSNVHYRPNGARICMPCQRARQRKVLLSEQ